MKTELNFCIYHALAITLDKLPNLSKHRLLCIKALFTRIFIKICKYMIVAVFVIAEIWKQPTCPRTDKWLIWLIQRCQMWFVHRGKLSFIVRMDFETKVSQGWKKKAIVTEGQVIVHSFKSIYYNVQRPDFRPPISNCRWGTRAAGASPSFPRYLPIHSELPLSLYLISKDWNIFKMGGSGGSAPG